MVALAVVVVAGVVVVEELPEPKRFEKNPPDF